MSLVERVAMRFLNSKAEEAHGKSVALMKFLSDVARHHGVAEHVYVVGGAVRNWLIGQPIKDIDVVVDSVALKGKDSAWFAKAVQQAIPVRSNLTTNQYGVAILTVSDSWNLDGFEMKGETIEIANARKESYGGAEGKGYKPHQVEPATIEEDLHRREFTFNTLLWRLLDLSEGPDKAEIIDLTGLGRQHLEERILSTPVDPNKTFSDDPTRMLRAIKFVAKYGFHIPTEIEASIRANAPKLKSMPWDAVRKLLVDDILGGPAPRRSVELMKHLGLADVLKEMLASTPGFAAALGRELSDASIHLVLDLVDLGWAFKTPVSFLGREGHARLREILLRHADAPEFDKKFVAALQKPPIDQQRLFADLNIPPKERGIVVQVARELLLDDPSLTNNPHALEAAVEQRLRSTMKFDPIVHRVAARFMPAAEEIDLRKLEITSENLEEVLKSLVASVDDLDAVEAKLGISLRNMTDLMRQGVHNDDLYHNGESVLVHIGWVVDDAAKLSANMDEEKRTLMKLTALFHDMGKAYTYKFDTERQKHTFHGHPELSVEIAKVLLAKHKESLGKLYQHVLDFTRLHDSFYALAHERSQSPEGSTKYVRRFMQEAIVQEGLARDLLEFARADSFRARSHAEKIKEAESVVEDLAKEKEAEAQAQALKIRQKQREQEAIPQIRERLEAEAPEAAAKLPDLSEAMQVLNKMKRYDILQWIMKLTRK